MELFQSAFLKLLGKASFKRSRRNLLNADPVSVLARFDLYDAAAAAADGFTIAMDCSQEQLRLELGKFPIELAGYAVEGAALAIGASTRLDQDWNRLIQFLATTQQHEMNTASGVGGAFAHAGLSISSLPTDVNPFWRWVLVDGYAFHQAFFNAHRVIRDQESPELASDWERHAYNQGIGRAMWYAAGGRPDLIKELINQFAPWQRSDMWYGVGLQAGYCGGIEKEFHQLRRFSGKQLDGLSSGVAMAVVTRASCSYYPDHTRHASEVICGADTADVVRLFEKTIADTQNASQEPTFFLELRERLAKTMLE